MDTSSPFAVTRSNPHELGSVSLSQLLAHIRASDQTEAFVQEVIFKSPARSVATTMEPRPPSCTHRSSKRSGIIVNKRRRYSSDTESDNDETATAITCSSIGSVSRRTIGGTAVRKKSLHSAWFDEDEPPDDETELSDGDISDGGTSSLGGVDHQRRHENDPGDGESILTIAQRAASRAGLAPSKRSLENLKNYMSIFDPSFSFSRTCVTSPVTEDISPLESWFFHPLAQAIYSLSGT